MNKKIVVFILYLLLFITHFSFSQYWGSSGSYDLEEIYGVQSVDYGTLAITNYGTMMEISKILVPIKLDVGRYRVAVRQVDTNLYEVIGKNIYVKTRSCYESAFNEDVILEITSSYGWSKGTIYFE